ncbi:hypothetical protein SLEP1_g50468 [Rubroshorea leprosula]|uniref:Uncharacterized protein n=1 Tax=Rubroshorea leprosula TaxID=152421 RepID=A0AAV5M062_9ROSI|nr:hypothetical protein SLEP1_g50468 [Rubroshorea leprosula]
MADLPESPFKDYSGAGLSTLRASLGSFRATPSIALGQKTLSVIQLIQALQSPETRELALQLLSKVQNFILVHGFFFEVYKFKCDKIVRK